MKLLSDEIVVEVKLKKEGWSSLSRLFFAKVWNIIFHLQEFYDDFLVEYGK